MSPTTNGDQTVYICVAGSVNGNFDNLVKTVSKAQKKIQNLAYLLCVGDFFAVDADNNSHDELQRLLRGELELPVTTYFIAGKAAFPDSIVQKLQISQSDELCSNLYYLGHQGVCSLKNGLTVAFLGGHYDKDAYSTLTVEIANDPASHQYYTTGSIQPLLTYKHGLGRSGVDILLTYDYPFNVNACDTAHPTLPDNVSASPVLADMCKHIKPRYHFASGGINEYFQLAPFENGPNAPSTRFFGLSGYRDGIKTDKSKKNLYAFFVIPLVHLNETTVRTSVADVTPSPYGSDTTLSVGNKRPAEHRFADDERQAKHGRKDGHGRETLCSACRELNDQSVRCQHCCHCGANLSEHTSYNCPHQKPKNADYVCRICNSPNHLIRFCPQKGLQLTDRSQAKSQPCWFCLNSTGFAKHLVFSIGEEIYLTLARGPLSQYHILLTPINHYPNFYDLSGDCTETVQQELEQYMDAITQYFAQCQLVTVFFELSRTVKVGHCHIQCVGVPIDKAGTLTDMFLAAFEKNGYQYTKNTPPSGQGEFFRVILPDGLRLTHTLGSANRARNFNFQFGREVLAQVLNASDRINWKDCVDDKLEKKYVKELKDGFRQFDFTLNDGDSEAKEDAENDEVEVKDEQSE